jgi:DNA repair protein RadC
VDYEIPIYRVALVREGTLPTDDKKIRNSGSVARLLQTYIADADREHFVVILVDQKHRVIGINTVSIGSLTAGIVHPREAFKPVFADMADMPQDVYSRAIRHNAAAVIFGHNHPSGDVQPSREDRAITKRLVDAGKLLGIDVLDHIIIGSEGAYFSFADENILS